MLDGDLLDKPMLAVDLANLQEFKDITRNPLAIPRPGTAWIQAELGATSGNGTRERGLLRFGLPVKQADNRQVKHPLSIRLSQVL
jgi:hypothetical protein